MFCLTYNLYTQYCDNIMYFKLNLHNFWSSFSKTFVKVIKIKIKVDSSCLDFKHNLWELNKNVKRDKFSVFISLQE